MIQLDLFTHHRLGLHHLRRARALRNADDDFAGFLPRGRPMDAAAIALHTLRELLQVVVQVLDHLAFQLTGPVA